MSVVVGGGRRELASLFERWLGQFLDGLVYVAIYWVPLVLLGALGLGPLALIGIIPALLYLLLQDGLGEGQSWGKRAVGTYVVDARTGSPCSFGQSFVRNLTLIVLSIIDWIFIFGERRQRLGDRLAGTCVIKR